LQTGAHLTLSPSWLVQRLAEDALTLVGIDHGFSFPLRYFETHGLLPDWPGFLDDSSAIGRPTRTASMWISFARALTVTATAQRAWGSTL
jgi:hypothetical protein